MIHPDGVRLNFVIRNATSNFFSTDILVNNYRQKYFRVTIFTNALNAIRSISDTDVVQHERNFIFNRIINEVFAFIQTLELLSKQECPKNEDPYIIIPL